MLSFQDLIAKTAKPQRRIKEVLQSGVYHPEDASLTEGLNAADTYEVEQALGRMSLAEVLVKGSSAQGADGLVAAKVYDTLAYAAKKFDLVPLISADVVNGWQGGNLTVPIVIDGSYVPNKAASAGKTAEANPSFTYATLSPVTYTLPILAGRNLIEDSSFGLVERFVKIAGETCAVKASDLAVAMLIAASDGDGTLNTGSVTLGNLSESDIADACWANGADKFVSNTLLLSSFGWTASLWRGYEVNDAEYYDIPLVYRLREPAAGFDMVLHGLDTKLYESAVMNDEDGSDSITFDYSIVFDRGNALLTGRKRWLEIKEFSNPIEDLAGAVVSFRQDSVTLYKDAICLITGSG
jgi:hypothetical protein